MNMLVRSAAAIAVVPAIAHASPVLVEVPHADPIFAAIEAHKRAVARWDEIFVQMGRLEDEISHEKRRTAYYAGCDSLQIIETDDPRWIALNVECENAYEAEQDATLGFTTVFPTTLQGVLDLLTYAVQQEVKGLTWPTGGLMDEEDPDFPKSGASWYYFSPSQHHFSSRRASHEGRLKELAPASHGAGGSSPFSGLS
jgi:hypothetical protein